jgi:hypothetical protein
LRQLFVDKPRAAIATPPPPVGIWFSNSAPETLRLLRELAELAACPSAQAMFRGDRINRHGNGQRCIRPTRAGERNVDNVVFPHTRAGRMTAFASVHSGEWTGY